MKKTPVIGKYLDVSCNHITKVDGMRLTKELQSYARTYCTSPLITHSREGWIVSVAQNSDTFDDDITITHSHGYSEDFRTIMRKARNLGCSYALIHPKGAEYPDLHTHRW